MESKRVTTYCCSVQGKKHSRNGIPCQDASCLKEVADGLYLLIIADGCSSAPKADEGSHAAITRVKDFIQSKMPLKSRNRTLKILKNLCYASLLEADTYLSDIAKEQNCSESDFATTLTVCLYDTTFQRLGFAHIGDGAIWIRSKDNYKKLTTEIRPPYMPDNYVTLLYHGASHWISGEANDVDAVLLCTDGILSAIQQKPSFYAGSPLSAFYRPMLEYFLNPLTFSKDDPEGIELQILRSLNVDKRQSLYNLIEVQIDKNFQHFCGEDTLGDPAGNIAELLWQIDDDKTICAVMLKE